MNISLKNLGTVNRNLVELGNLSIWFSYKTPVAYKYNFEFVCRQNDWSTTTGKLLNELEPDKSKRVSGDVFEQKLKAITDKISLN